MCIESDILLWKVTRLIKDPEDYTATTRVLFKYAKVLTHLFMFLSSKSNFPAIGLIDFGEFCKDSHIIDAKLISSNVDRQFIAATSPNPDAQAHFADLKKKATKEELLKL